MKKINQKKENEDHEKLLLLLKDSKFMDEDVVVVNCMPEYSSIISQKCLHSFTPSVLDMTLLELPHEGMNQVWNRLTAEYEFFDRYLGNWARMNIDASSKYLFISLFSTSCLNKIKHLMRRRPNEYLFACVYTNNTFEPDLFIEEAEDPIFEWQEKI